MCLIFYFEFLRNRSFRGKIDMSFIDIYTVSVRHTLTRRVQEYLCAGVQEYRSQGVRGYVSTEEMST